MECDRLFKKKGEGHSTRTELRTCRAEFIPFKRVGTVVPLPLTASNRLERSQSITRHTYTGIIELY